MPKPADAPSDHFDGERFFNPQAAVIEAAGGASSRVLGFLRWRFGNRRVPWEKPPPEPAWPPGPHRVAAGTVAAGFVGHSTFLLRFAGGTVLTDPIFSDRCSPVGFAGPRRARPPGIPFEALPPVDVVLLSHSHYDHMDLPTLRRLRERNDPRFVTMRGSLGTLRSAGIDAVELDWWDEIMLGAFRIVATPARHFSARTPWDFNRSLWGGYAVMDDAAAPVLFAGDSGAGPHWAEIRERIGAPALAFLPIGAYLPRRMMRRVHMDPHEAVEAHLRLGARDSVGMHWGTFPLAAEAIDAPPKALAEARVRLGVAPERFRTLGFGQTSVYPIHP